MTSSKYPSTPKVIVTAAPYGLGPASNLVAIASLLADHLPLRVVVDDTVSQYVEQSLGNLCQVESISRERWWKSTDESATHARAIIAVHEPRACRWAARNGIASVFVDSLAWVRPPNSLGCNPDLYIWQKFFSVPSSAFLDSVGTAVGVAPIMLAPIVPDEPERRRVDLLVNLGGMISPEVSVKVASLYAEWIAAAIEQVVIKLGLSAILCAPRAVADLMDPTTDGGALVLSPNQHDFRVLVASARAVLTVPGIESVLECLDAARPLMFLPPLNGSQAVQLAVYREHGIGISKPDISDSHVSPSVGSNLAETTRQAIVRWMRAAENGAEALATDLMVLIQEVWDGNEARSIDYGSARFNGLGSEGAQSAVSSILSLLGPAD